MKKKIILLVSVLIILLLAGGGIASYYFWYMPVKEAAEEKESERIAGNYIDTYYDLLEANKFVQAQQLLKEYRNFVSKKKSDKQLLKLLSSYSMENAMWYMQKNYEKMNANLPEMEQLLKKIEKSNLSGDEILGAKWVFIWAVYDSFCQDKEYKRALKLIQNFIDENGGENKLKKSFLRMFLIYDKMAKCYEKLGKNEQAMRYYKKAVETADNKRSQHILYINMALLSYEHERDLEKSLQYLLQAEKKDESQCCYFYLAAFYRKLGKKEEAKKYYFLASVCERVPRIANPEYLKKLEEKLFE